MRPIIRKALFCDVRVQDVDTTRREVIVRAQGDRQRMVPLPEMVYTELLAYLLERGGKRGPLLRTEKFGKSLRANHVCNVVSLAAERAGITREITRKALRHSYAFLGVYRDGLEQRLRTGDSTPGVREKLGRLAANVQLQMPPEFAIRGDDGAFPCLRRTGWSSAGKQSRNAWNAMRPAVWVGLRNDVGRPDFGGPQVGMTC